MLTPQVMRLFLSSQLRNASERWSALGMSYLCPPDCRRLTPAESLTPRDDFSFDCWWVIFSQRYIPAERKVNSLIGFLIRICFIWDSQTSARLCCNVASGAKRRCVWLRGIAKLSQLANDVQRIRPSEWGTFRCCDLWARATEQVVMRDLARYMFLNRQYQ